MSNIVNDPIGTDTVTASPNSNDSNLIERRTYFRDTGTATAQQGKNALVSINHTTSVQTVNTIQDRALWVQHSTPTGAYSAYGVETLQMELNVQGTPTFTGSPDGEATVCSLQMGDYHTGNITRPTGLGANVIRAQFYREAGAGCWSGGDTNVIQAIYENLSTQPGNSQTVNIFSAKATELGVSDGTMSIPVIGFRAYAPSPRFKLNWGFYCDNFGTNASDFNIESAGSMPSNGKVKLSGPVILPDYTPASASDTGIAGSIAWDQNFMYRCTATNTWKRVAISTW